MKTLNVFVFLIMVLLNLYSDDLNWKNTERILDLEIFPWTQNILGKATGAYLCLNSTDTIVLDLVSLPVDSVIADGLTAEFYRAGDTLDTALVISLGAQQWPGDTVHIDVFYHGTPLLIPDPLWAGGLRINAGFVFSIHAPFGLKAWVPCLDNHRHKAWVKQYITVPSDFVVMSNGRPDSAVNLTGNRKKFFWSETRRLIPYIQGIAASNYTLSDFYIDTFPVMIATYPQDSAGVAFAVKL